MRFPSEVIHTCATINSSYLKSHSKGHIFIPESLTYSETCEESLEVDQKESRPSGDTLHNEVWAVSHAKPFLHLDIIMTITDVSQVFEREPDARMEAGIYRLSSMQEGNQGHRSAARSEPAGGRYIRRSGIQAWRGGWE